MGVVMVGVVMVNQGDAHMLLSLNWGGSVECGFGGIKAAK